MKLPTVQIPLTTFAAIGTGLIGVVFAAVPLVVLPTSIRAHGFVSMMTALDLLVAVVAGGVVVFSVGLALREKWARCGLVYLLVALIGLLVVAIVHSLTREHRAPADIAIDLILGPSLTGLMVFAVLFLLNRPLQEEISRSEKPPNKVPEPTAATVTPVAEQPSRQP